jgi:N-acylglucosamine-6-phosphate 2-epimerase
MTAPFAARALVISCQAAPDSPLHGPEAMTMMARAVALGGAAAIRANGPADVRAIVAAVDLPVIGIWKTGQPDGVYITPSVDALTAGLAAADAGADLVATTLSGYTSESVSVSDEPDVRLVEQLAARVAVPVVAEGRYRTGADVRRAFDAGAYAVVIGTAVTNPTAITRRLIADMTRSAR